MEAERSLPEKPRGMRDNLVCSSGDARCPSHACKTGMYKEVWMLHTQIDGQEQLVSKMDKVFLMHIFKHPGLSNLARKESVCWAGQQLQTEVCQVEEDRSKYTRCQRLTLLYSTCPPNAGPRLRRLSACGRDKNTPVDPYCCRHHHQQLLAEADTAVEYGFCACEGTEKPSSRGK